MKRNLKWLSAAVVLGFMLASCSSSAHIEKDDNADFSRYKTFAWIDKDGTGKNDHNKNNDILETRVRAAVNKELEKSAGWHETKNRPDLLLSYDVLVERSTRETSNPVYSNPFSRVIYNRYTRRYSTIYYPSQFLGYDNDERPVKEGTVTISMIDTRTDKTVWQGWSTDEVDSRNMTSKEIQAAVKSIFKKFDIAKN